MTNVQFAVLVGLVLVARGMGEAAAMLIGTLLLIVCGVVEIFS